MNDLFNMDANTGMDFLEKKSSTTNDGIYRPQPKNAKDKKKGYRAVVRFLPNLTREGQLGASAIEKMIHYVKLANYPELGGYYDSMRNFNEKCELTNTFWQLKNSKSVVDQEKAEQISRSTKYYSYVLVLEDENQPELEGKIMVFPFGYKIKEKLNQERTGEITGEPCNVYDLANGKDFVLLVKEVGGYTNYDSSQFLQNTSPLKIKGKPVPTEEIDGRTTISPKYQEKIKDFLLKREIDLEDFAPVKWDDEVRAKVNKIVSILTDNPIVGANESIDNASSGKSDLDIEDDLGFTESETTEADNSSSSDEDPDDFFDNF
jgi:hypothetical protein